jgi:serine/threonine protein kinase
MKVSQPPARLGPWHLETKLGAGAFGQVFTAHRNGEPAGAWVVKVAPFYAPAGKKHNPAGTGGRLLYWEHTMYSNFAKTHAQFPRRPAESKHAYGEEAGWRYLALEHLGLGSLEGYARRTYTMAATCTVGIKLLSAFEQLHARGVLYRDLKPENVMMDNERWVVLVDFGACVKFMLHSGKAMDTGQGQAGTPRFMARHVHNGAPPAPRDDVESLAYLLLWMLRHALPWDKAASTAEVARIKNAETPASLCRGLAPAFADFFQAACALEAGEAVNYAKLKALLAKAGGMMQAPLLSMVEVEQSAATSPKRRLSSPKAAAKPRPPTPKPRPPTPKPRTLASPPRSRSRSADQPQLPPQEQHHLSAERRRRPTVVAASPPPQSDAPPQRRTSARIALAVLAAVTGSALAASSLAAYAHQQHGGNQ